MIANVFRHPVVPHDFIAKWHESREHAEHAARIELDMEPLTRLVGRVVCKESGARAGQQRTT
jgi:hypothetical protein